jgi:hypothetical protein
MSESKRFNQHHVQAWRDTGFVVINDFFSAAELDPVLADFETMYVDRGEGEGLVKDVKQLSEIGGFHPRQFMNFDQMPYDASPAINLISLHPSLIEFSRALLDAPHVHCYQSHSWAKYTGEADYDQAFHCDFSNHTLTVPSDNVTQRSVDFVFYISDVTNDLGALHYVTKPDAERVLGPGELEAPAEQQLALKALEQSAAGPSGTLVAHSIDTFHRGTNLTQTGGRRFTMTVGYKASGNEKIGFHVWQYSPARPWQLILNHASAAQLEVIGIPRPGDEFWTERTLRLTQKRWPDWNMTEYFAAHG